MATATLTWTYTHTTELGFECERKTGNLASPNPFGNIGQTATGVLSFVDSGVTEGSPYCYRVRAWNTKDGTPGGVKQFSAYSNTVEFTPSFAPPAAPTNLVVS
jgi:hypothetical protein